MNRFLETCASYIYQKYGNNLSDVCLIFPNRRAGVFFNAYLRHQLTHPVIGPKSMTVNEFMNGFSDLSPADPLKLIALLYETFLEETGFQESFDTFYFWGEILLSDFDEMDKYLVDASDLFRNILSLKEIDQLFDYLSQEQKQIIRQFWGTVRSWEKYPHEKQFVTIWEKLSAIYTRFRQKLITEGIGYSGLIIRHGVECLEKGRVDLTYGKYLFIGLNALDSCEKRIFSILNGMKKAEFFWDYDNHYVENKNNNAGRFIRENLGLFPSPDNFHAECNHFQRPHNIRLVAVASQAGQAQIIPRVFDELKITGEHGFDHTAIVLADESLLFHVLGAIPSWEDRINVTMGYPLKNSPLTGFLMLIFNIIRNTSFEAGKEPVLYHKPVTDILSHQMLKGISAEKTEAKLDEIRKENKIYLKPSELDFSEIHRKIFSIPDRITDFTGYFLEILKLLFEIRGNQPDNSFMKETIFATYLALEKLKVVMDSFHLSGKTRMSPEVFFRLMSQYLNQVTVPFEGEPLCGIQVMGILETRCLDFDNLIIIGLNEDIWPRNTMQPSLIPFSLRKGFGLPVSDDQDGIYAYYFYRLIQRAENITATWNTIREGLSGGELSRLGFQLIFLSGHTIIRKNQDLPFRGNSPGSIKVPSSPDIVKLLISRYTSEKALSPSAIVSYLTCSLKFYFRYVADLKEPEEVIEDIDRQQFGKIFHKAAENLYQAYTGKTIDQPVIDNLVADKHSINEAILKAFATEYFFKPAAEWNKIEVKGKSMLIAVTIESYIRNLLETDRKNAPFYFHALEKEFETKLEVESYNQISQIRIGGIIDRLDEINGVLRVVDYKTGSLDNQDLQLKSFDEIFSADHETLKKEILQTLIYALILKRSYFREMPVQASVYAILNLADKGFDPSVRMNGRAVEISAFEDDFDQYLKDVLRNIFSPDMSFSQTEHIDRCRYCPYNVICRRE